MAEHAQLAKILGLLGSSQDGEVLAAARSAVDYLRRRNLRWGDLLAASADGRGVQRRLLALRAHALRADCVFDKDERAELKTIIREALLGDAPDPSLLRRIEWLEAVMEHEAEPAPERPA